MAERTAAAVRVRGVGKRFRRVHSDRPQTLQEAFLHGRWSRLRSERTDFWALRDVAFDLAPGTMTGVVGANGAGKTTLLRIVGGVVKPNCGSVRVSGRIGALELGTGFHPELTGRESVFVSGVIAGMTRRAVAARFDDIVAFAELGEVIDSPLRTYSTGMKARLAFAVAAHVEPDVLLVDEVLAVGDARFQQRCLDRIAALRAAGCCIVFVSHDTAQIAGICDRALLLEGGRLAADGPAKSVVDAYLTGLKLADPPPDGRNPHRSGSGDVVITAVRLLGADSRPAAEIAAGGSLVVEIAYEAMRPVPQPRFGVLITRDDDGAACCDLLTPPAPSGDSPPRPLAGRGVVRLRIDRLDLSAGRYWADAGIYSHTGAIAYDYHWRTYGFAVRASGVPRPGILLPPHRWESADGAAG